MNLVPSHFALTLALIAAGGLATLPAHAESLADVVAHAYETNPGLLSQRATVRAADEQYVQARGSYGPNVSVNVSGTTYDDRQVVENNAHLPGIHDSARSLSESLSVAVPLYTGGRVHSQLNQAEALILAQREQLRRYEMDLLVRVVSAYANVRRDEALLKVSQDTVAVLEKQVADTNSRFDVRQNTLTDVAEAKARLAQSRSTLANAQGALGISRAQYISVVGQAPGTLDPLPTIDAVPPTITQAFDSAENYNPQLLGAQYTEQRSRARIAEARAGRLPSVSVQASLQHAPYIPYLAQPYNYAATATVSVSQPLFTSGQISSQIRQATEQNNSDRLAVDETRNQVILGVTSQWEQIATLRNQIKTLEAAVEANTFSFYGNREEEKNALRSTIDVLNAQLELTNTQQAMIRARAEEYVGQVQLLAVMGVLNPAALSPDVRAYDPAQNFRSVQHKGETPLEWPARTLDAIGGMRVGKEPAASVAEIRGAGSAMPAAPDPEAPITSILSTLDKPPPVPR